MYQKLDNQECGHDELFEKANSLLDKNSLQILSKELKKDDLAEVAFATLENSNVNRKHVSSDEQWKSDYIKKLRELSSPYALEYHCSEVKNAAKVLNFLLWIFAGTTLSTIILVAICIFKDLNGGAIISSALGVVIDMIVGWMVKVYNTTLKSKKTYFDAENEREKTNKMLFVLQAISCQETKDQVIADIVRKYFNV